MVDQGRYRDLANGRTQKVAWSGKKLRLRVRPGRSGSKLELSPGPGSGLLSSLLLAFLGLHWFGFGGRGVAQLIGSLREEIHDPAVVLNAAVIATLTSLMYVPFVVLAVLDRTWWFEPHLATRHLNLLGMSVRARTYDVIDASVVGDRLVLRTADQGDVIVGPPGMGLRDGRREGAAPALPADPKLPCAALRDRARRTGQMSTQMGIG
jgi:hypothetical protein